MEQIHVETILKRPGHVIRERRYQRASCDFPAEFRWGTISNNARVRLVGIGGCFLTTQSKVPEGEEITVLLMLDPDRPPVVCLARVAWLTSRGIKIRGNRAESGFAVEFQRIFPEDRARIDVYVRSQIRIFRAIEHELSKQKPDADLVKELFRSVRPGESTHAAHIRKACRDEKRHYRLSLGGLASRDQSR